MVFIVINYDTTKQLRKKEEAGYGFLYSTKLCIHENQDSKRYDRF